MADHVDGISVSDLHDRIAKVLGWSTRDAQSLSMASLRELVRPVDPNLARELDYVIQSGEYVRGVPGSVCVASPTKPRVEKRRQ